MGGIGKAGKARLASLIAFAIGGAVVVACSSSDKRPNGTMDSESDAAATLGADATTSDAAGVMPPSQLAAASDAGPAGDAAACPGDVAKLESLLTMSACGICTLEMCKSFATACTASCACVDALLSLLDCVMIGNDVPRCQMMTLGALSPTQIDDFITCNATCGTPCSSDTFFPDAAAPDPDAGDASDAGEPGDVGDDAN